METFLCIVCGIFVLYLLFRFWKFFLTLFFIGVAILAIINWETTLTLIGYSLLAIIILFIVIVIMIAGTAADAGNSYYVSPDNNDDDEDRHPQKKVVSIARAVQNGDKIDVYDTHNILLYSKFGHLEGYTDKTVTIKEMSGWIISYDADGHNISDY